MKRIIPFILIMFISGLIILAIMPACDELVTNEYYSYDTITLRDSTCIKCHSNSDTTGEIALLQWRNSGHASDKLADTSLMGQNIRTCGSECHNTIDFVQYLGQNVIFYNDRPAEISCYACHKIHSNWDFTLRSVAAVNLIDGSVYNNGVSNICVQCHHSLVNQANLISDSVTIDNSVWDAWDTLMYHGMGEVDLLLGRSGFEHDFDSVSWVWSQEHSHDSVSSKQCITCHQDSSYGYTLGGHSLNIIDESNTLVTACNTAGCHSTSPLTAESIAANQKFIEDRLYDLKAALGKRGLLNLQTGLPDSTLFIADSNVVGALYNYFLILNDKSKGMHNFVYDTLLLRASLDYLAGDLPPPKK